MSAQGFTLIELLIVVALIGILSTVAIASYRNAQDRARDGKRIADAQEIAKAAEQYRATNNTYVLATTFPCNSSWRAAFNDATYGANNDKKGCPASVMSALGSYFAANIPQDPYCQGTNCSNGWSDYLYSVPLDGNSFILYVRLENTPTNNNCGSVSPPSPYNYCQLNQQ